MESDSAQWANILEEDFVCVVPAPPCRSSPPDQVLTVPFLLLPVYGASKITLTGLLKLLFLFDCNKTVCGAFPPLILDFICFHSYLYLRIIPKFGLHCRCWVVDDT